MPFPPHRPRVLDRDDVVDDLYPLRSGGRPLDDEGVVPGVLELGAPVPSHVPGRRQLLRMVRPQRGHRDAGRQRGPGAGQRAAAENDPVRGVIRLRARRHLVPQDLVPEAYASQKGQVFGYRFLGDYPRCQVDSQDCSGPSAHYLPPLITQLFLCPFVSGTCCRYP